MKGKVKFFNAMKGFGFIAAEDGQEIFVHQTGLKEGTVLRENDAVEFDVEQGDKGPKAINVRKVTEEVQAETEAPEEKAEEVEEVQEEEAQ